jgi:hypothetical protein
MGSGNLRYYAALTSRTLVARAPCFARSITRAGRAEGAGPRDGPRAGALPDSPDSLAWKTRAQDTGEEETPGAGDETTRFFFSAPRDVARRCRAVVCSVRRRLQCTEGAAWGWMFDHALEAWGANEPGVRREHRVIGSAPGGLHFELGLRAGQQPLLGYCSGDQLAALAVPFAPCSACETSVSSG